MAHRLAPSAGSQANESSITESAKPCNFQGSLVVGEACPFVLRKETTTSTDWRQLIIRSYTLSRPFHCVPRGFFFFIHALLHQVVKTHVIEEAPGACLLSTGYQVPTTTSSTHTNTHRHLLTRASFVSPEHSALRRAWFRRRLLEDGAGRLRLSVRLALRRTPGRSPPLHVCK
ncbi:hypothetical protein E2C01_062535 [Portunus trituberculatus]|uniref:Uncharacterized protein n=1 Tax=Portunus trituberculatus TaxID=210409 RepID=A0A5B7HFK5_PORTR|nr:hypothetical protein [Portunus trituberculatus]